MISSEAGVTSPCNAICVLNPETGFCRGCHRTMAEIGGWGSMSDEARLAVLEAVKQRRVINRPKRRGRRGRSNEKTNP